MTSNIGANHFRNSQKVGFMNGSNDKGIYQRLRGYFKDEFINRIDDIILFSPLGISALKEIAKIKIRALSERLSQNDIHIEIDDDVYNFLGESAMEIKGFGARPLTRLITSEIENKVAEIIVHIVLYPL